MQMADLSLASRAMSGQLVHRQSQKLLINAIGITNEKLIQGVAGGC
jgi:hypothetical protein